MTNYSWIKYTLKHLPRNDKEKDLIIVFWKQFYASIKDITDLGNKQGSSDLGSSKSVMYKEVVFNVLDKAKQKQKIDEPFSTETLRKIQTEIEDLTMKFDDESMYKTYPNLIKNLIRTNEVSAKDFLRRRLSQKDIELLSELGQYTIEAIIVHVLGQVFNTQEMKSMIRVPSLVEQLESNVRLQASLLISRRSQKQKEAKATDDVQSGKDRKISKLEKSYPIGTCLVEFMVQRELITLSNDLSGTPRVQKMKATWDKRISVILESYEDYTRIVCGDFDIPEDGWFQHKYKWNFFSSRLCSSEKEIQNYSVHY